MPAWAKFYAEDAVWIEYRHTNPPKSPNLKEGRAYIEEFLGRVKASGISIRIEDELVVGDRAAFRVWITLPDGRRIIEHVMIKCSGGRIARQVDVEAWD